MAVTKHSNLATLLAFLVKMKSSLRVTLFKLSLRVTGGSEAISSFFS